MKLVLYLGVLLINTLSIPAQELQWWQSGAIYQIYPRSFKDSNGDGIGDLKGITSKLDYLVNIGINTVWLSPIFKSPMADFGYDISDFRDIDPIFGTMQDFEELAAEMKKRNISLVLDFVPNHSSDEHEWFVASEKGEEKYTDYYVWMNKKGDDEAGHPIPPNNWRSVFGGSAWEWSEKRQQFYLHQFHKKQPDLNYRNPAVVEELKAIIEFWLNKGADGFRVDAIAHMFEDPGFRDEPLSNRPGVTEFEYDYLNHIYTKNYNETYEVMRQLRIVMDNYSATDKKHKLMLTEAYESIDLVMKYYGTAEEPIADLPFNFEYLGRYSPTTTGTALKEAADLWFNNMPKGEWANWVSGNHDQLHRTGSKVNSTKLIDAVNMINLLLPGTSITYYGEEIGMLDTKISFEETQDPWGINFGPEGYEKVSRDPSRTPMQWDNTTSAGFSTNTKTWLPINPNYVDVNVNNQQVAEASHLKVFRQLVNLRKEAAIQKGELSYPLVNDDVFCFMRRLDDTTAWSYIVLVNFGNDHMNVNIKAAGVPAEAIVHISSVGAMSAVGTTVKTDNIHLMPKESYVLCFIPAEKSSASSLLLSSSLLIAAVLHFVL